MARTLKGRSFRFDYPSAFTTLPDYTAHIGQTVKVIRRLGADEADTEVQPMYEVRAADGWRGHAFRDELADLT